MADVGNFPDGEVVICAWIRSIPNLSADIVDVQMPWDLNVGNFNGYVQVTVTGGAPDVNLSLFHTVAQVDCWVEAPSEDRYFRMKASDLVKQIQYNAYDRIGAERAVQPVEPLGDGSQVTYRTAHVYTVQTLSEPHRMVSTDNGMYEGYSVDLNVTWTTGIQSN